MSLCHRCAITHKDWDGSKRVCAFEHGTYGHNWNCATINRLRDHTYEGQELLPIIDYQYCSDRKYVTINLDDFSECTDTDSLREVVALWVAWYKSRGETNNIFLLDPCGPARTPTENELNEICDYLDRMKQKRNAGRKP